ncbi:hypothetical protein COOONC_14283 [Cooperia oncophora]
MRAVECMFATKLRSNAARLQQICDSQLKAEWIVWQTGIELLIKGHSVFVLKQFYAQAEVRDLDYTLLNFRTRDEQKRWRTFPLEQYPAIGTRFAHSSEGDLLVNRFVPCSKCAAEITTEVQRARDDADLVARKSFSGLVLLP